MSQDYIKLKTFNHSAYRLFYHLILSVKYRKKCISKEMLDRLEEIFRDLLAKWDCRLVEFGGEADHVHILFEAHPTIELAKLIKNLKSVSSRRIRSEYAEHLSRFFSKPYFWNRAYAVISVGRRASIETLLKYIENQDEPARLKPPTDMSVRR